MHNVKGLRNRNRLSLEMNIEASVMSNKASKGLNAVSTHKALKFCFYELIGNSKGFEYRTIGFKLNNEVAAFADITFNEKNECCLLYIYVNHHLRGAGLGKRLISILKKRYNVIFGYALNEAIGFYDKLGFTITKTQINYQISWKKPQNGFETSKAPVFEAISEK